MGLECMSCGAKDAVRLTYSAAGPGCDRCRASDGQFRAADGVLHVRGVNKLDKKMTHATKMHITTRRIGPDGQVRSLPRWETRDY